MTTVERRRANPVAELLGWLESEPTFSLAGMGLTPFVRVEDFIEDDVYRVRAELPGVDPDKDVTVEVEGDVLTIRGERKEEQKEKNRHELHYGSFERRIRLPKGAVSEDVKATYSDGVLEVRVPMDGEKPAATSIPIDRAAG